jgi:hypothetical protein
MKLQNIRLFVDKCTDPKVDTIQVSEEDYYQLYNERLDNINELYQKQINQLRTEGLCVYGIRIEKKEKK